MTTPATPSQVEQEHRIAARCNATAGDALAFLADGLQLGRWALGCWDTQDCGGGVVSGHSLFDGSRAWVRPVPDANASRVVYWVGGSADALHPRIVAEVKAEPSADGVPQCQVALHATRSHDMDDDRWLRLVRCHEVEILLIQSQLNLRQGRSQP